VLEDESVDCAICGPTLTRPLATRSEPGRSRKYSIVECRRCGLVYVNPRRPVRLAYAENADWPGAIDYFLKNEVVSRHDADVLVAGLIDCHPKATNVLDLGCGAGFVLSSAAIVALITSGLR